MYHKENSDQVVMDEFKLPFADKVQQENPYVQYFLGLKEFRQTPLFDSPMMVHFRKRFPVEFVAQVNEYICTGKWPEEPHLMSAYLNRKITFFSRP